jgi:hypothetical protein
MKSYLSCTSSLLIFHFLHLFAYLLYLLSCSNTKTKYVKKTIFIIVVSSNLDGVDNNVSSVTGCFEKMKHRSKCAVLTKLAVQHSNFWVFIVTCLIKLGISHFILCYTGTNISWQIGTFGLEEMTKKVKVTSHGCLVHLGVMKIGKMQIQMIGMVKIVYTHTGGQAVQDGMIGVVVI